MKLGVAFLLLSFLWPQITLASSNRSSYFDWGAYYGREKVLGITFSSLEGFPAPPIPDDLNLPQPGIVPGSVLYPFETLIENVQQLIIFDPTKKAELRLNLASERLAEAKVLIERQRPDLAQNAVSSYKNEMAGIAVDLENLIKSDEAEGIKLMADVEAASAEHLIFAQALATSSSPSLSGVWDRVSDVSQNAMDRVSDIAGKPAIPEELSASLQNLKEQGLITPEESTKLYGLAKREEVRDELDKLAGSGQFPLGEMAKLDEAVRENYPESFKAEEDILRFAELRSYQIQLRPSADILAEVKQWQNAPGEVPPPQEIRPYLYYPRAQELASKIDLGRFNTGLQAEVVGSYPREAGQNPTYSPPPAISPEETPPSPTTQPYLVDYNGPLPGNPAYIFKQLGETLSTTFTFNTAERLELEVRHAEERLREANILAQDKDKEAQYSQTLERYTSLMDRVSNGIKNFRGNEDAKEELAGSLERESARHNTIFEKGALPQPAGDEEGIYEKVIEATQDAMDRSADALEKPPLPSILSDRLQDLKAQGVILGEEITQLTQANSREEVRDEIRKLAQSGAFPPADAKKLDEAQAINSPGDYNQLVEVRKVEELNRLRAIQSEFAQTASLRAADASYEQRIETLLNEIDPALINKNDLAGREDLLKIYEDADSIVKAKPLNEKQLMEARRMTYDPNRYHCEEEGAYYSFIEKECIQSPKDGSFPDDAKPSCPDGTTWFWNKEECQESPKESPVYVDELTAPKVTFVAQDSPFYFIKSTIEAVQLGTAFGTKRKEEVRIAQAKERFAEAYYFLEKKDEEEFGQALGSYTDIMQEVYNDMSEVEKLNDETQGLLGETLAKEIVNQNLLLQKAVVLSSIEAKNIIDIAISVTIQGVDRAADLRGEPAIPQMIREKIESLPPEVVPEDKREEILAIDNRVEARLKIGKLASTGVLNQTDTAILNSDLGKVSSTTINQLTELQKINEAASLSGQSENIKERVEKTEGIAQKLNEFQKNFAPGEEIPEEIRPYMRLTRIEEVSQTIRPDIIRVEDFQNRKDIQLAVATLQAEFRPTKEAIRRVEEFRRNNPGRSLPFDLARTEALSFSLGVRENAETCFLPSPPFPSGTPCPPPGAAIPIYSYSPGSARFPGVPGYGQTALTTSGEGGSLEYGKGPEPKSPGACPDGYHWMYDSGGWCMSNGGNYSSSYSFASPGSGGNFTPYSPYYSAPGYSTDNYSPSSYYGSAPTYYTTNPPPGTVPGTGPAPVSEGQCPSGFHWMPPSFNQSGWCMADGPTYVPSGTGSGGYPTSGYNYGGTTYSSSGGCPPGQSWSSVVYGCIPTGSTPGYYSPNLTQSSCGPGYYWDGTGCIATYSSGGQGTSSNYCQGLSCGGGTYLDYSTCSCKYPSSTSTSGGSGSGSCSPPSAGCGSNSWYDYGTCSCKASSTTSSGSTGSSSPSTGSCPSGYHWMSDNGGWCMADGGSSGSGSTSSPSPESPPPTTTTSSPPPSTTTEAPPPADQPPPSP